MHRLLCRLWVVVLLILVIGPTVRFCRASGEKDALQSERQPGNAPNRHSHRRLLQPAAECNCTDITPNPLITCARLVASCNAIWMVSAPSTDNGYCQATCKRCSCENTSTAAAPSPATSISGAVTVPVTEMSPVAELGAVSTSAVLPVLSAAATAPTAELTVPAVPAAPVAAGLPAVALPPSPSSLSCPPLEVALNAVPGCRIMAGLLSTVGISRILGGTPATLFAPTDDALMQEAVRRQLTLPALLNDTNLVDSIARYHCLAVPLTLSTLARIPGQPLLTLLPGSFVALAARQLLSPAEATGLVLEGGGGISSLLVEGQLNGASIILGNIQACNSFIHVLGEVLQPPLSPNGGVMPNASSQAAFLAGSAVGTAFGRAAAAVPGISASDTVFVALPASAGATTAAPALQDFLQELAATQTGNSANSSTCSTIPEVVGAVNDLSMLLRLLTLTRLIEALSLLRGTLFVPTNEAFLRVLAPAAVEELMSSTDESDIAALSLLIQGWTVPSPLLNAELTAGLKLPTFLSNQAQLQASPGIAASAPGLLLVVQDNSTITGTLIQSASSTANVMVSDVLACSSIIHVVDSLLLASPSSLVTGGVFQSSVAFLTSIKASGAGTTAVPGADNKGNAQSPPNTTQSTVLLSSSPAGIPAGPVTAVPKATVGAAPAPLTESSTPHLADGQLLDADITVENHSPNTSLENLNPETSRTSAAGK